MYLYLKDLLDEEKKIELLHFAPEKFLTKFLKAYPNIEYLSVDLDPEKAMKAEDIRELSFDDSTFDMIFCSHVLEHIDDDHRAMTELVRVLKNDGFAIIQVPLDLDREKTYEDASITSPEERTREFWQHDHLRLYGKDFPDKLREAGFVVKEDDFLYSIDDSEIKKLGLEVSPIYFCTVPIQV